MNLHTTPLPLGRIACAMPAPHAWLCGIYKVVLMFMARSHAGCLSAVASADDALAPPSSPAHRDERPAARFRQALAPATATAPKKTHTHTLTHTHPTFCRIGKGGRYSPSTLPAEPVVLWAYEPSPFCRVVRERLVELEIPHLFRSTARGSAKRQEMFDKYGKFQAPLLEVRFRRPRESRHPWCWVAVCSVTLIGGPASRHWRCWVAACLDAGACWGVCVCVVQGQRWRGRRHRQGNKQVCQRRQCMHDSCWRVREHGRGGWVRESVIACTPAIH